MNDHKLKNLSKTELIELIFQYRKQLQSLQTPSEHMENGADESEASPVSPPNAERSQCLVGFLLCKQHQVHQTNWVNIYVDQININDLFPPPCVEMVNKMGRQEDLEQLTQLVFTRQGQTIEKVIRNAFRYLDNVHYLEKSQLAKLMAETWQIYLDGSSLQQVLTQAIESVNLLTDQAGCPRWQLRYDILILTYHEKMKPANVALRLSISERQYYRELRVAIHTAAQHLVDLHR